MTARADTLPKDAASSTAAKEPSLPAIVLIFWSAFAVAVVGAQIIDPSIFQGQDPDSFLRMVEVRDLLGGQNWFDLVQHRMNPPGGALMQWSRLIDAPLAALVIVGNKLGLGENLALTGWPLLLYLGLMGAAAAIAKSLGGRAAAIASLFLVFCFVDPLVVYLPGDIDHHNAQIMVTMATVAFVLRFRFGAVFGVLAGAASAVALAIGLEMLPHIVVIAGLVALRFAWTGENKRAVAAYAVTLGVLPGVLYFLTGSPEAAFACDSLSWSLSVPALIGGAGLGALALFGAGRGRGVRLVGLAIVGAAAGAYFIGVTPQCLSGPYGQLPPEVKRAFLDSVSEAQPIWEYAAREPLGTIGSIGPLAIALWVAFRHLRRNAELWLVPSVLLVLAVGLSFYEVRTLPFASAISIAVLAVWLAELRGRALARSSNRLARALPPFIGFALAIPFLWMLAGWGGEKALGALSDGRIAPLAQPKPDPALVKGLTQAEINCFDPSSAALFAKVPRGLVLSPVFYGSTVLLLSNHDVVAGPYHRNGQAILDSIDTIRRPPAEAKAIIDARGVNYIAICSTASEAVLTEDFAPNGLLADLLAGRTPPWLKPIPASEPTKLRLWQVVR